MLIWVVKDASGQGGKRVRDSVGKCEGGGGLPHECRESRQYRTPGGLLCLICVKVSMSRIVCEELNVRVYMFILL